MYSAKHVAVLVIGVLAATAACAPQTTEPANIPPHSPSDAGVPGDSSVADLTPSTPIEPTNLSAQSDPTLANTSLGQLQGRLFGHDTIAFLGVPYGAPPIGPLRWKPTQLPSNWSNVRDATKYPTACQQSPKLPCKVSKSSEDCLYLNVLVPKKAPPPGGFKVLVYFHGGSLYYCSANSRTKGTEAEMLSAMGNDVILVAVNFRLGPFGFMPHPDLSAEDPAWPVSGNYGLLDMIRSLEWVQQEITNFGGDPGKVAISGSSGGSIAVHALYGSVRAAGLFQAGCGLSWPGGAGSMALKEVSQGKTIEGLLGCDTASDPIACMRSVPAEQVSDIVYEAGDSAQLGGWGPVADGVVVEAPLMQLAQAGKLNKVPFCAGSQRLDMLKSSKNLPNMGKAELDNLLTNMLVARGIPQATVPNWLAQAYAAYPIGEYPGGWGEVWIAMQTDQIHTCRYREFLMEADRNSTSSAYWFRFDHGLPPDYLPRHPDSWNFLLGRVVSGVNPNPNWSGGYTPSTDDELVTTMFNTFLKNMLDKGVPSGPTVPDWPSISASPKGTAMLIKAGGEAVADFHAAACDFWDALPGGD